MTLFPVPNARSGSEAICAISLTLTLLIATMGTSHAQVQIVTVGKSTEYAQTSATAVNVRPLGPNYGGPYGFSVRVEGQNISGITVPTFTGPINFAAVGSWYNSGKLVYNPGNVAWDAGPNGNGWGSPTLSDLNSKFPSGIYTITVNGTSIPLQLTGDAYPNVPLLTLAGGAWANGKYVLDAGKALTITTNVYTGYGSHRDDVIGIVVQGVSETRQFFSAVPGTKFMTRTVPASTFVAGQEYMVATYFVALVDLNPKPTLPGSLNAALYGVSTAAFVSVAAATAPVCELIVSPSAITDRPSPIPDLLRRN